MKTLHKSETHSIQNHPLKILIVENGPRFRDELCATFKKSGFKNVKVTSGSIEAFARVEIESEPYDAILIDVDSQDPEMPAPTLCHFIRAHETYCECPVIMIGKDLTRAQVVEYFREGADDVLSKPIDVVALELITWKCLRNRKRAMSRIHGSPGLDN